MPIGFPAGGERYANISPWVDRYRREFTAKGVPPRKANDLAYAKARRKYLAGRIQPARVPVNALYQ